MTHCIHTAQALDDLDSEHHTVAILQRDNEALRVKLTQALSERDCFRRVIDERVDCEEQLRASILAAIHEIETGDKVDALRILREAYRKGGSAP